ncbi:hypothetical protein C1752_03601 [Acaryochloris thomasi RCC1774]|uniref:O-antigen ligase-related domain-containing protein n=1 Tax=Acaryochloris thomasi RCC1774 TaxID=1764569 RepID=A0A2W1JU17_9CYAN|nr:O-antigen ligase family protein [Acaryochloris thomasi]PZD72361.1 hypothetical protein C1752_03601 [Acaryochloris thomasi RCC1774]
MESNGTASLKTSVQPSSSRDLFGPLAFGFYALFTLLPDSSSLVVAWPWVLLWQVGLFLPWLWLLRTWWMQFQLTRLGYGLDYGTALTVLGVLGSTLLAQFPQQARWHSWAALCAIAALYALNTWCSSPSRRQKLLAAQGGLSLAFIAVSLSLWFFQTLLPEMNRLADLRASGLERSFDFSVLELRNWAPIGHQNYVAGFLVLTLPLLIGLCLRASSKWKWVWGLGALLGLVDLYTTSSRGGWLGMALVAVSGVVLLKRLSPRFRWLMGLGLLIGLFGTVLANNRLRALLVSAFSRDSAGSTVAFRLITNATGWAMGLAHPLLGAGPGSVPLLYQSYRPAWAGREAELVYQLHGTPAQVWAELGALGIALCIFMIGWLVYWGVRLWQAQPVELEGDRIMSWSLLAGLGGYGIVALTDYQLDIVCISGTLILYLVGLLSLLRQYLPLSSEVHSTKRIKILCWGLVGLLLAVGIWLAPIHRAWQLSSRGFAALAEEQFESFTTDLEQAHQLAPWEPYYSYQLGWNLGSVRSDDAQINQVRARQSLEFFERHVQVSPSQESGTSSLGWQQLLNRQPSQSTESFLKSTQLMPAKRGGFYSLGQSLLLQGKADLGVQAIALEILRDPLFLTSPLLQSPPTATFYPQVQEEVVQLYQQLLKTHSAQDSLTAYLHQCLGGVYWWQGNLSAAAAQWEKSAPPLGKAVLSISRGEAISTNIPILKAWLEPQQRIQWLERALLQANQALPKPQDVQALQAGMERSDSFEQWVKKNAPLQQYPRVRAGFGVLSRHIDGPAPSDFFPVVENAAVSQFLAELFPSLAYSPALDIALQPFCESLWRSIQASES